jgi:RND family efflux transporter MFP subunit
MTHLKTHHLFAALAVALLMSLLTGLAIAADKTPAAPKAALTVTLVKPESRTITSAVSANGTVAAWQEASVSAELSGFRLTEVNAQVGDVVKKGQILARFSQESLYAEIAATKAQMAEAQASYEEASANANRARELVKQGFYSAQAFSQTGAQEKAAGARLEAAKANLSLQTIRLGHSELRAPDSGVITSRSSAAALGSVVAAGVELFRMNRQGRLEWRGEVTATELANIKRGSTVKLDEKFKGTVRQIAPNLDAQTRNAIVFVDIAGANNLKVGQFVRGEFAGARKTALTLPFGAVVQRDGFAYVFAVQGNKVKQVKISLGQRTGNDIEVLTGVDANTAVVATGAAFLTDGDTVKVVQP